MTSALQKITRQCVSLAEASNSDTGEDSESVPEVVQRETTTPPGGGQGPDIDYPDLRSSMRESSMELSVAEPTRRLIAPSLPPTTPIRNQIKLPLGLYGSIFASSFPFPSAGWPLPVSPPSIPSRGEAQWTFMQRLVRECCQVAYGLLVNSPNNVLRVQEVFGSIPPPPDRNRMIASFYEALQNESEDKVRADVLTSLRSKKTDYTPEQLKSLSRACDLAFDTESGADWLDAYGVQRFLSEKGIRIHQNVSIMPIHGASPSLTSFTPLQLDVAALLNVRP